MGLQYSNQGLLHIDCFSDADWAADKDDIKSIVGYCVYFGPNLISWCSKKQGVVSRPSTESKYRALTMAASEVFEIISKKLKIGVNWVSIKKAILKQNLMQILNEFKTIMNKSTKI